MKPRVDWVLFASSVALIVAVCIPMALAPERSSEVVDAMYKWIAGEMGLLYQWMVVAATVVLAVIAFGKFGRIRLGGEDVAKEFSNLSWISMLFCAGIGAGIMYWATIEWAYYLDTPPFGVEPNSPEAQEWAATYGIFHWGLSAWCLYCLPTVAIAYPYYQRKIPYLRLSTALVGLCGDDIANKPLGRIVDFIFIIALVGGTGTSLGLATPMIAACVAKLFGIEQTRWLEYVVVFMAVALFAFSVFRGLNKGIKLLSDVNMSIAGLFVLFVLFTGPTLFALKHGTNSLGIMVQEFIRLNTWTDPVLETNFVENWSIFYWAWWLAYGPYMGIFVTRISRGRTLRELILGMIGFGHDGVCDLLHHHWQHGDVDGYGRLGAGPGTGRGQRSRPGHRQHHRRALLAAAAAHRLHPGNVDLRCDDLRFRFLRHRRVGHPALGSRAESPALAPGVLGLRAGGAAHCADAAGRTGGDQVVGAGGLPAASGDRRGDDRVAV